MSSDGIDIEALRATFSVEAAELVSALEAGLLALEHDPTQLERIHEVFRAAHSLKGGAATIGLVRLVELTHVLEDLLDRWRNGTIAIGRPHFDAMLGTIDLLHAALGNGGEPVDEAAWAAALSALAALRADDADDTRTADAGPPPPAPAGEALHIRFAPLPEAFDVGCDPLLVLRELRGLSTSFAVAVDHGALPALEAMAPNRSYLTWEIDLTLAPGVTRARVAEAFEFVESVATIEITAPAAAAAPAPAAPGGDEADAAPAVAPAPAPAAAAHAHAAPAPDSTIRVATEKVDALVDLVGELVISHSTMRELVRGGGPEMARLQEAVLQTERHLRELQERVMAVRMVPVSALYARVPRLVREVAQKLGKQVELALEGGETELDKVLVERLVDPVFHLVRNALDHGIEAPDVRAAAGKPATGTLTLRAYARGGSVYLEVADDGGGLRRARILEVARARGLEVGDDASDAQVFALIAAPGFSTASAVTELSGRGVGLDVVRRNIEQMGGELSIESHAGAGTCFRLRLPLTLTIMDGLQVVASGQTWVMPLVDVAFSTKVEAGKVRSLAGLGEVIDLDGETLPVISLGDVLHRGGDAGGGGLAVVVQAGATRYALRVDRLLGQTQVVVKSLETHFRRVPGMIGATILGDGQVALILDGQGLAASVGLRTHRDGAARAGSQPS